MPFRYEFAALTDTGAVRQLNEDAFGADLDSGLFIVADGLGGYNAGEIASALAVSALLADLSGADARADPAQALKVQIEKVNRDIYRAATHSVAFEGMATTVVLAWLVDGRLWVAHAGDSRLYRLRQGELKQLTRDHSFSQELLDAGMLTEQEARQMPARNLVTRALGVDASIEPDVCEMDVEVGDLLLLCTDGISEALSTRQINDELAVSSEPALMDVAARLIALANAAGGRDNASAVLVRISGSAE
jgi:serine/threonine protein phosphatase PrpC